MIAHLRRYRISPKKAQIVAGLIRNQLATSAEQMLKLAPGKSPKIFAKVLHSAIANAKQQHTDIALEKLMIKQVLVSKGPVYKRRLPSTRGRALPINKPTSHITIELSII